jgi:uncharacterized membrane protein
MDLLIWINTPILILAVVVLVIMLYMSLQEVRKSNEALSRVERLSLATLEWLTTQRGSPV